MKTAKIVIPGQPMVKKNNMQKLWFRKDKQGRKIPLSRPVLYYTGAYKEWGKKFVEKLIIWKSENFKKVEFLSNPENPLVLSCLFFLPHSYTVDLTALIEGVQDILAGNVGSFLDKTKQVEGTKHKIKFNHNLYKIIPDDNWRVIKNLGSSTVLLDPQNPRTEIYISEFSLEIWSRVFKELHPEVKIGDAQRTLWNGEESEYVL